MPLSTEQSTVVIEWATKEIVYYYVECYQYFLITSKREVLELMEQPLMEQPLFFLFTSMIFGMF